MELEIDRENDSDEGDFVAKFSDDEEDEIPEPQAQLVVAQRCITNDLNDGLDALEAVNEEEIIRKVLELADNNKTLNEENEKLKAYIQKIQATIVSSKISKDSDEDCGRNMIPHYKIPDDGTGKFQMIPLRVNEDMLVLHELDVLAENSRYLEQQNIRLKNYVVQLRAAIRNPNPANVCHVSIDYGNLNEPGIHVNQSKSESETEIKTGDNEKNFLNEMSHNNLEWENNYLKEYIQQLREILGKPEIVCRTEDNFLNQLGLDSYKSNLGSLRDKRKLLDILELPEGIELSSENDAWIPEQNPLLNSIVLGNVFKRLDFKSLQESRLVCQTWNEIAVPVISKNVIVSLTRWTDETNITSEGILKLRTVLENGSLQLFNYFQIEVQLFDNIECQKLLSDFGMYIKTLEIDMDPGDTKLNAKHLYSILVDWCPNLDSLDLCNLENRDEEEFKNLFSETGIKGPLKLTQFEFDVGDKDAKLAQILIAIVNASPNLHTLKGYFHPRILMEFFVRAQNNPRLTKNLKELIVHASDPNQVIPVEILFQLDIEFSDNLKHLTLGSFNPFPRTNLLRLLKKVATSLETLVLCGQDNSSGNNYTANEIHLPAMKKLKQFKNFAAEEYRLNSIHFLSDMENLETLVLSGGHNLPLSKGRLDALFANCNEFMRNPHKKLTTLILLGQITSLRTVLTISRIFPKLSTLYIQLGHGERGIGDSRPSEKQEFFREAMEAVFDIETLKVLYLDFQEFRLSQSMESDYDLTKNLATLPNLRSLTLINGIDAETSSVPTPKFLPYFLEAMFGKGPNLRNVKLIDFEMALTDARNLFETMNMRKIVLEISDDPPTYEEF